MYDGEELAHWDACTNWEIKLRHIIVINNTLWQVIAGGSFNGGSAGIIDVWPYNKEENA